jgi:serine/threonine protein phosphatase PrpC
VVKKQFAEGDLFFVMGCDGTWELLSTENICKDIEELFNK